MSVVSSCFDPSGQWLASVVPSLDIQKLRIHAVAENISKSLKAELDLPKGVKVHSLLWIVSGDASKAAMKKRKRSSSIGSAVPFEEFEIALGLSTGNILLFSPFKSSTIATLESHSVAVTSLSQDLSASSELLSADVSGQITKWDLIKQKPLFKFKAPMQGTELVRAVPGEDQLLLASTAAYLVDGKSPSEPLKTFSEFAHTVDIVDVCSSDASSQYFFSASENERNIVVSSLSQEKPISILVAQSDVQAVAVSDNKAALAVLTEIGSVEIFLQPLKEKTSSSKRRSSKAPVAATSNISIKVSRPKESGLIKIEGIKFDKNYLTIYWLENGTIPVFEKVQWLLESGEPVDQKEIEIVKARISSGLKLTNKVKGIDPAAVVGYNEATSIVTSGNDVQDLESDDEEETLADRLETLEVDLGSESQTPKHVNGKSSKSNNGKFNFSTPGSFAVILNQALKTNDHTLLETCLSTRDEDMVKVSVQRLDSTLAVKLLERLAEKMSRTPTRAGQLNVWVKWVMIAHGGYIVTMPNLLKSLSSLHSLLAERVSTLPRLLALQGRLEMLKSQMELRRDMKQQNSVEYQAADEEASDEEAAVEYIEDGEYIVDYEDDFSESEDEEKDDEDDDESLNGFIRVEAEEDDEEEEDSEQGYSDMEDDDGMDIIEEDDEEEVEQVAPTPKSKRKAK